ncbi:mitochondrial ribosomal protein L31-domain-containing protein [Terfezia claveryi]|nr:mitochondrial ribosomal protein L31-domain-containing protein [Terfezia claveryi]
MLGLSAFKPTGSLLGGLLWKIPYRLSRHQKYRHRQRLRHVDKVVDTLSSALSKQGVVVKEIERWKSEMPREDEMEARDKYTVFARNERKYRKGIHKVPKWTRVSQRVNPPGY